MVNTCLRCFLEGPTRFPFVDEVQCREGHDVYDFVGRVQVMDEETRVIPMLSHFCSLWLSKSVLRGSGGLTTPTHEMGTFAAGGGSTSVRFVCVNADVAMVARMPSYGR